MDNRVNVVCVPERLDRITQALLLGGFQTLKIGKRQKSEGPDCYLLGRHTSDSPAVVEDVIKQAALSAGYLLAGVKVGRRAESAPWQADFTVVNLFEDEDDRGMSTLLRGGMPGYQEIERASGLRDALERNGIRVKSVAITPQYHSQGRRITFVRYEFFLVNPISPGNASAGKSHMDYYHKAVKVIKDFGIKPHDVVLDNFPGLLTVKLDALEPPLQRQITFESDADDMAKLVGKAVEATPEYGDEKRLQRFGTYLKANGWTFEYVEVDVRNRKSAYDQTGYQMMSQAVAMYSVGHLRQLGWTYATVNELTLAIQNAIAEWTAEDAKISGHIAVHPLFVHVRSSSPTDADAWVYLPSFKRSEDINWPVEKSLEWTDIHEAEDMSRYTDTAVTGLRTRMFINDLRNALKAAGLPLYGSGLSYRTESAMIRINIYLSSYGEDGEALPPDAVGKVRAILSSLGRPAKPSSLDPKGVDIQVRSHDQITLWLALTVDGFEGEYTPTGEAGGWVRESEDIDTMLGIGERERLYAIMRWVEGGVEEVLWAVAEPAMPDTKRAPGSTFIRLRLRKSYWLSTTTMLMRRIYVSGIVEPLNSPDNPQEPDMWLSEVGDSLIDVCMYAAPVGKPLKSRIYAEGPNLEKYRHVSGAEPPDGIIEELDPETELWVRHVVEQTPGYLDKERLKAALKALTDNGFEIEWASQSPGFNNNPEKPESLADVVLCIRHREDTPASTTHYKYARDKIEKILKAYWNDVDNVFFQYASGHGNFRVFAWDWTSHDSPENQTTFTLRAPDWEQEAIQMLRDYEQLLIMEADPPMENEPDDAQFAFTPIDLVGPEMHDRLRVEDLAKALEAYGYDGRITCSYSGSDVPYLQLSIWVPLDAKFNTVKANLRQALILSGIASDSSVDSIVRGMQQTHPASNASHVTLHFVWKPTYDDPNKITHGIMFGESVLHPIVELLPEDNNVPAPEPPPEDNDKMLRRITRAAINTPEQVIIRSFQHAKDKLKEMGYTGHIRVNGAEGSVGGLFTVDIRNTSEDTARRVAIVIQQALLDGGLRRYYPRRMFHGVHAPWPYVDVQNSGHPLHDGVFQFHCLIKVRGLVKELHVDWPSIQEGLEDMSKYVDVAEAKRPKGDPSAAMMRKLTAQTLKRVYPDLEDQERLRGLATALKAAGFKGFVRIEPNYKQIITGKKRGEPPTCIISGSLIPPLVDDPADSLVTDDEKFRQYLIKLMSELGFGKQWASWGYSGMVVQPTHDQDGVRRNRFHVMADASTLNIDDTRINLEESDKGMDLDAFVRKSGEGTIWDNRRRILDFCGKLAEAGYAGWLEFVSQFVSPESSEKGWIYGSGRLVIADMTKPADDEALRKTIQAALRADPDFENTPLHVKSALVHVTYKPFPMGRPNNPDRDTAFKNYPYYFFVNFFMAMSEWKEDGNVLVTLPSLDYSIDVKI